MVRISYITAANNRITNAATPNTIAKIPAYRLPCKYAIMPKAALVGPIMMGVKNNETTANNAARNPIPEKWLLYDSSRSKAERWLGVTGAAAVHSYAASAS